METKKVILILLTIFILGPLVFIGTCFPLGFFSFGINDNYGNDSNNLIVPIVFDLSIAFAIYACYRIIRDIIHPKSPEEQRKSIGISTILALVFLSVMLFFSVVSAFSSIAGLLWVLLFGLLIFLVIKRNFFRK